MWNSSVTYPLATKVELVSIDENFYQAASVQTYSNAGNKDWPILIARKDLQLFYV